MRKYNIIAILVRAIEHMYDKAISSVQPNVSTGEWYRTTFGVRQRYFFSPTFFTSFSKRIMSDALEEHDGKVSSGDRTITGLRLADDTDVLAEKKPGTRSPI